VYPDAIVMMNRLFIEPLLFKQQRNRYLRDERLRDVFHSLK